MLRVVSAYIITPMINQVTPEAEWMTTNETAALLRTSRMTLLRLRDRGEGPPAYKLAGTWRYSRSEVVEWLRQQVPSA